MNRLFAAPKQKFPADFEAFYSAYPRREDKLEALKAWKKAIKIVSPEELIEAAKRYAGKGTDRQFTKLPATWLNRGAWMNEEGPTTATQDKLGYLSFSDTELQAKARIISSGTRFAEDYAKRLSPDVIEEMKRRGYL